MHAKLAVNFIIFTTRFSTCLRVRSRDVSIFVFVWW